MEYVPISHQIGMHELVRRLGNSHLLCAWRYCFTYNIFPLLDAYTSGKSLLHIPVHFNSLIFLKLMLLEIKGGGKKNKHLEM